MPRRQAKPDVPRWRRGRQTTAPLSPKQQDALIRQVAESVAAGAAGHGHVPQGSKVMARTGAFRFRYQLIPVAWILFVLAAGMSAHLRHDVRAGLLLGVGAGAGIVLATRHLSEFARAWSAVMAFLTALWLPVLALAGLTPPVPPFLFGCWLVVLVPWARHYRIRREPIQVPDVTDYEVWNLLAAERKWNGHLGVREDLPGGGRRYAVQLDGIKTTIGNVLSASENVAGAWHKPMTEAYAERDPHGITSRGYLTVLGRETLMKVREWNGAGIDPQSGQAVVGRYADGSPVHVKFYTRRYGTRHALISGTTGSGKSELLNLLVHIALVSGYVVPVILDPQEGQSLPFWRDRCLYAAGVGECMAMLDGLHAGMLDRSAYLAGLRWDDDGIPMRGMGFFDYELTGLPIPLIIIDEAHMLLKGDTKDSRAIVEKTVEIGRLGRKTGTALWLATHIPSLSDLGGEQALRDMLRGGNTLSMRTANRVATGMLGLEKDPSLIPMFFTDGRETYGLGYAAGPDNRPDAPMRSDLVPRGMRRKVPAVPALDDRFAEAMDRAMSRRGTQLPLPAAAALAAVPPAQEDKPGRSAADAILKALTTEMDRGKIIIGCREIAGEWSRKPFSVRAIGDALAALAADGKITKTGRGTYAPVRASLHAVPQPAGAGPE